MDAPVSDLKAGVRHMRGEEHAAHSAAASGAGGASAGSKLPLTAEEKRIRMAQGLQSWLMAPWQIEFFGVFAGGAMGWVFEKLKWTRAQVFFDALVTNPLKALNNTTIGGMHHLHANYTQARAESVAAANQTAERIGARLDHEKAGLQQAALEGRAAGLKAAAERTDRAIAGSKVMLSIRKTVGGWIDGFANTGMGRSVENTLRGFFGKRHEVLKGKHASKLSAAHDAFTTEAPKGLGVVGFFKGTAKETVDVGAHLQPHHDALEAVRNNPNLTHEERVSALEKVKEGLEKFAKEKAPKGDEAFASAQRRAGQVLKHVDDALHHARGAQAYALSSEATNLRGIAKKVVQTAAKIPMFHALIGASVVAGLTAVALTSGKEKREAKEAYQGMVADLGGDEKSPYMQSVQKAYQKQKRDGAIKTGASAIGEAANIGLLAMPGGAGMAMMAPAMMPALVPMFVQENMLLNAYAALKSEENGKIQLQPAQKLQLVKELVAGLPTVQAHGGAYNTLVTPVAQEIIGRNLSVKDTLRLISNDKEFTAIASKAAAQMQALKAAQTPAKAEAKPEPKHETKPEVKPAVATGTPVAAAEVAEAPSAEAAYLAAEKPSSKIAVDSKVELGRVNESQLAMAGA